MTITCANGKWTKQVSCEPVDCGLPDKYHVHPAQFVFPEGTTYGKRSTFHCREPAQLVGESQRACTLQRTLPHGGDLAARLHTGSPVTPACQFFGWPINSFYSISFHLYLILLSTLPALQEPTTPSPAWRTVCGPSPRLSASCAARLRPQCPTPCCRPSAATRPASRWGRSASTSASRATTSPTSPSGNHREPLAAFRNPKKRLQGRKWANPNVFLPERRAFKRQCTEDGSWLEGACEPVTCEPPPAIFHGSYRCTDGFRFDSVCRLNCTDPAGNTASAAAAGGSAHTVRLLHAPCKQVCPSSLSPSFYSSFPCLFFVACFRPL